MDFKEAFRASCEAYDTMDDMLSTVPYRMGLNAPYQKKEMDSMCQKEFGRSFDQMWRFCRKGAESKDRELLRMAAAKGAKQALEMIADRSRMKDDSDGGTTIVMDIGKKG